MFAGTGRENFIVGSTLKHVLIWDVSSSTLVRSLELNNSILLSHPLTPFLAAVYSHETEVCVSVFDPESEGAALEVEKEIDSEVIDACFLAVDGSLSIYLLTANQRLYGLSDKEVMKMPLTQTPDAKGESIFADLLKGPAYNPENLETTQLFRKADLSIFETPCHLLPPPKTYSWSIISELLPKREIPNVQEEVNEDDIPVDITESMDIENGGEDEVKGDLDAESEESVAAQLDYSWLDSFFKSPKFVLT